MPTTLLGQKVLSAAIEQSVSGMYTQTGTYTRIYIVKTDDECDDEYSVLFETTGLPNVNDRSDVYPALRVTSRSAVEVAPNYWEVTIVWTMPEMPQASGGGGSGGGGGKRVGNEEGLGPAVPVRDQTGSGYTEWDDPPKELPPWWRPGRVSFNTVKKKTPMTHAYYFGTSEGGGPSSATPTYHDWTKDRDKRKVDDSPYFQIPFTNSAGEPYNYDTERVIWQATYERSIQDMDFELFKNRVGTVNGIPATIGGVIFPPYTVLWSEASLSQEVWTNPDTGTPFEYWNLRNTYEIDFHTHFITSLDKGSKHYVSNDGPPFTEYPQAPGSFAYRNPAQTSRDGYPFVSKVTEEFIEGFLNGYGGEDTNGEVNFLYYMPHRITQDW